MDVIGAGFGRTGTSSLKEALDVLGYKTHHMSEVFKHQQVDLWVEVDKANDPKDFYEHIYFRHGYNACVDHPNCMYYAQLLRDFPKAKVVLTVREPKAWLASVRKTIYVTYPWVAFYPGKALFFVNRFLLPGLTKFMSWTSRVIFEKHLMGPMGVADLRSDEAMDKVTERFDAWVEEVKAVVPSEQLLIFEVKQGWEPLCTFLGKPVPETPFPRSNSTDDFQKRMFAMKMMFFGAPITALAVVAVGGIVAWKQLRN